MPVTELKKDQFALLSGPTIMPATKSTVTLNANNTITITLKIVVAPQQIFKPAVGADNKLPAGTFGVFTVGKEILSEPPKINLINAAGDDINILLQVKTNGVKGNQGS
jgi:hypothetical protein